MTFKHYINSIEIEEPDGFNEYAQEIIRDDEERIIRYNFPLSLTFIGDGYDMIEAQYQENYNAVMEYRADRIDGYVTSKEVVSTIKISNCEFNLTAKPKPSVNVDLDDNVYQAKIFGNKKRPVAVTSLRSLNNVPIIPAPVIDLTFFNTINGADMPTTRKVYDVFECLRVVIDFITDGSIELVSDWYTNLPDDEKIALTTGVEIRDPGNINSKPPIVSYQELFDELWKKYNLYFIVQDILTDSPKLRLEPESYLYQPGAVLQIVNNDDITRTLDYDKLYNRVSVGSNTAIKDFGSAYPMFYTPLLSFVEETYNIDGFISVDNELDLVSKYVIDTNEIYETLLNTKTGNDEKIFLIQYTASTGKATQGDYFPYNNPAYRYYNERFLNSNVADRFNYLGDFVLSFGNLDASFQASQVGFIDKSNHITTSVPGDNVIYSGQYPFTDDSTPPNFDTAGNYDTGSSIYTAPADGLYRFNFQFDLETIAYSINPNFDYNLHLYAYLLVNGVTQYPSNAINILPTYGGPGGYSGTGYTVTGYPAIFGGLASLNDHILFVIRTSVLVNLQQGDTVEWGLILQGALTYGFDMNLASFFRNGIFSSIVTPFDGGEYQQGDPDRYYIGLYHTPKEGIVLADWQALKDTPIGAITIDTGNNDPRITRLKKISRNIVSGESELDLLFNRNQRFK